MYRGSRKHVLDWIERPEFIPELLDLVAPASPKVTARSTWAPRGYRDPDEARLEDWGPRHLGTEIVWRHLARWWLAEPRGANTPNWDLAMTAELEGELGLILVEAKANVPELGPGGKKSPRDSAGSLANDQRINEAIETARCSLAPLAPALAIRGDSHYQLSNRLAFTWKLASAGVPTVLLYLGFTGDDGIRDVGAPFADANHWMTALNAYFAGVGAAPLLGRRHQLDGAPFWIIAGARAVLECSPPPIRCVRRRRCGSRAAMSERQS